MSIALSVHLPDNQAHELYELADATRRPLSLVVREAIESYLEDQADLQIALERLNDSTDPILSLQEMRAQIGV